MQPVVVGLIGLALLFAGLMFGKDIALFNPKGLIAQGQARLMMFSVTVLLAVAIPTLSVLYFFAWKYRETNKQAKRNAKPRLGKFSTLSLWVIPTIMVAVVAFVALPATYKLDPHKALASDTKPLTIQVIAMRWKWLFIYPERGIATVNYVQIPVDTPVEFKLTADEAPMNSFWIPHLGGQLYAMTGHDNRVNLMADTPGEYMGQAAEINGPGFAGMKFIAKASSDQEFNQWVQMVQQSSNVLSSEEYNRLLAPSEDNRVTVYSRPEANLYHTVLMKYQDYQHQTMEMP